MHSLKICNCPDVADLTSQILKETYDIVVDPFTVLINLIITAGIFPDILKLSEDF